MSEDRASDSRSALVWKALSDPHRRRLIDALRTTAKTTTELSDAVGQSRFATMKHLEVLVRAGLVIFERRGRQRWNRLNAAPLRDIYERWVEPRAGHWAGAGRGLASVAEASIHRETAMAERGTGVDTGLELTIATPPERVWRALFDQVDAWWPQDFHAAGPGVMRFEETLGGRLYEETEGGGGVLWYTVYALEPGRSVDLSGQLAARYGGPATSLVRIELSAAEGGHTTFRLTDSVFGRTNASAQTLDEGWRGIFETGLRAYLDTAAPA